MASAGATGVVRSTNVERKTLRAAEVGSNATRAIASLARAPGTCAQVAVAPDDEALQLRAREVRHAVGRVRDEADRAARERREHQPARVVGRERAAGQAGVDDPARRVRDPGPGPAADEREARRVRGTRAGRRTRGPRPRAWAGLAPLIVIVRAAPRRRRRCEEERRNRRCRPSRRRARLFSRPIPSLPRRRRGRRCACRRAAGGRGRSRWPGGGRRRTTASTARRRPVRPRRRTFSTLRPPRSWRDAAAVELHARRGRRSWRRRARRTGPGSCGPCGSRSARAAAAAGSAS